MTSGLRSRADRLVELEHVFGQPAADHGTLLEDPEFPGILAWDGNAGGPADPSAN
jgi:hypothetical protein